MTTNFDELVNAQRKFFSSKKTIPYAYRIEQLKKLATLIQTYESQFVETLYQDLHKSKFEAWGAEVGVVINELNYYINNLKKWMLPSKIKTPLFHFRSTSYIQQIPYGNTLIIAPWNYPFLLVLRPLIGALAAGNTAIVKPSENAPATAALLEEMINQHFEKIYLHVINTDIAGAQQLIQQKFDYIFFTGGESVGKLIYQEAAKNLTPVTLELGGKNPCIVDETAQLDITAARITWGKFSNCGQTCVAPDYILVHKNIREALIQKIISNIEKSYGKDAQKSPDYGRIVNAYHHQRITKMITPETIIYGGQNDINDKYIAPTLLNIQDPLHAAIMQQEIFGPVLPIITYTDINETFDIINQHPNPLVAYLFTNNTELIKKATAEIKSGDMSINEAVIHFGQLMMPVGGVGNSGIGKSQGKSTFLTFSHPKSVMYKKFFPDLPVRYPPYSQKQLARLKLLFRYLFTR